MNKIESKITAYKVLKEGESLSIPQTNFVPLEREEVIQGCTYKFRSNEHTYYMTVNDILIDDTFRPYEVFINSKNVANFAHLTVVTRLISAFFRTGFEFQFIAEELKQIVDPSNGYFKKGKRFESLEAEIGEILSNHFEKLKEKSVQKTKSSV